jgi:hypothetical protein
LPSPVSPLGPQANLLVQNRRFAAPKRVVNK